MLREHSFKPVAYAAADYRTVPGTKVELLPSLGHSPRWRIRRGPPRRSWHSPDTGIVHSEPSTPRSTATAVAGTSRRDPRKSGRIRVTYHSMLALSQESGGNAMLIRRIVAIVAAVGVLSLVGAGAASAATAIEYGLVPSSAAAH